MLKDTVSTETRFLLRTEYNLWRERGLAGWMRWNQMLTDAWLRDRLAARRYRTVTAEQVLAARKSDTVFIFGSGASLNELSAEAWQHFRAHDVFGFNAFYRQQWIPVDLQLLRVGIYGSLRWKPYAEEVSGFLKDNPLFSSTIFVLQGEYLGHFCNQLTGYGYLPAGARVFRYRTARGEGPPARRISEGIRHSTGTLADAVNVAYCLGWKRIVLVGVDLYDSRYFYLPSDTTPGLDERTGVLAPSEFNTYRGIRYDQTHSTARRGVVDLMRAWRTQFNEDGVELSVHNPRSLLAEVLPVYEHVEPTVTAIVQARMSSRRFPGKVLALFRGVPILEHVLRAAETAVGREATMLATSTEPSDDALEAFARTRGTRVVRGDLENVLARFQKAARACDSEWILRIGADSPMLSDAVLQRLLAAAGDVHWDLITTTFPRTFPKGQNAELIRRSTLLSVDPWAMTKEEREHVTEFFYQRSAAYRILNVESHNPALALETLAVDTPEDLARLEAISESQLARVFGEDAR
jgi:spore coat polysaccharide biosynthesis protein SpsF